MGLGSRRRRIFLDEDLNMETPNSRHHHARMARDAAREAISTLTLTARRQYRRYRKSNPDQYLGWETWMGHYREVTDGPVRWPDPPNDGMNNIPGNI